MVTTTEIIRVILAVDTMTSELPVCSEKILCEVHPDHVHADAALIIIKKLGHLVRKKESHITF